MANIDAQNMSINSGFYAGNRNVNMDDVRNDASVVCKGTVRSYCVERGSNAGLNLTVAGVSLDSGAFAGRSRADQGTVNRGNRRGHAVHNEPQHPADYSMVIGTLQSFNVGIPLGYEPFDGMTFTGTSCYWVRQIDNEDNLFPHRCYGTLSSFNALGGGAIIDVVGATINSGCGAGNNNDVNTLRAQINRNCCYQCGGTMRSFNAAPCKQINVRGATLNTGAFAGIATQQGGTPGTGYWNGYYI